MKNTTIRTAVALLAAICGVCTLSACGGSSGNAQSLLNDTFSGRTQIESGDINLSLALSASGSNAATKPLSVTLSGPFQNAGTGKLPRFALQVALDSAGHALRAGASSTGSALYVELAGTWFSTPESTYTALQQGYAQATKTASTAKVHSTFASLGIEPGRWLSDPVEVGTTTIAGAQTIHLTANVNVAGFLADVSKLSQAGGTLGLGSSAGALSPSAINELANSITAAHVDIYTGKSDHLLRRLELDATVTGTPQTKAILGGLSTAELKLQLELSGLNKPQQFPAPSNPEPFTQLLPALQQLVGVLQGVEGSSGPSSSGSGVLEQLTKG